MKRPERRNRSDALQPFRGVAVVWFTAMLLGGLCHESARAEQSPTKDLGRVVLELKQLPDPLRCWPELAFDASSRLLCVTWTTWATNASFVEQLHYAILDEKGTIRCDSESNTNTGLILKFPRLYVQRFHPEVVCYATYTNQFLDAGRWAIAQDMSSCVRVRQQPGLSDVVELWSLKPAVEKRWGWTRSEKHQPPYCSVQYVTFGQEPAIAVVCSSETVFLDTVAGKELQTVSSEKDGEVYVTGAVCVIGEKGWLISARCDSKRLRVQSLEPPHHILKEVGREGANWTGGWFTHRIESLDGGRRVLKQSDYSCRGGLVQYTRETEIFDTDTWKSVWKVEEHGPGTVAVSPDGKRVAIRRGKTLEIRALRAR